MKISLKYLFFFLTLLWVMPSLAQKNVIIETDSLTKLLPLTMHDTARIKILRSLCVSWNSRNIITARKYIDQALVLAKQLNDNTIIAKVMVDKGYNYSISGESAKAIQILQETIKLADSIKSSYVIQNAIPFIGVAYLNQGDNENALRYIKKSR